MNDVIKSSGTEIELPCKLCGWPEWIPVEAIPIPEDYCHNRFEYELEKRKEKKQ